MSETQPTGDAEVDAMLASVQRAMQVERDLLHAMKDFVLGMKDPFVWADKRDELVATLMARLVIYIHDTDVDFDTIDGLVEGKLASFSGENK